MPPARPGPDPATRRVRWTRATRIIATRYPPIDLFERVSNDPAVWDALIALEQRVNPRIRDEAGEIHLVPPEQRVSGPGASYVMAAFTHPNPKGSRFSDGSYGVYYAAKKFETALRETAYHFGRFAHDSHDGPRYENMRVLVGRINTILHNVSSLSESRRKRILDLNSYAASQPFAAALRDRESRGLVYQSVRHTSGECVAAFRPTSVGRPTPGRLLQYHWDGMRVQRYFDYTLDKWIDLNVGDEQI